MNSAFDIFTQESAELLHYDIDEVMDALFNIMEETELISQIKDILDELDIIRCIGRQQDAVTKPFLIHMFNQTPGKRSIDFDDSSRLGNHFEELAKAAKATYRGVGVPGMEA